MPKIQESAENYLETILVLKERNGTVRSVDIAAEMGFSKPSVSVAMKNLRERECMEAWWWPQARPRKLWKMKIQ